MKIKQQLCDICGTCVSVCPTDAIRVSETRVWIEPEICISCGKCALVCPIKAIYEGDA